ncbi:MAG: tRNA pseudouridine(55) synthase TruB [Ignavibacteriaceae bacterium]
MITKGTNKISDLDFLSGQIILIDKPMFWSSFKVVHEIRKLIGTRKIGHAGTLDPLASGLLILCTGKKTKEMTLYQEQEKTYTGTILLGKTTPSMDTETEITSEKPVNVTEEEIYRTRDQFLGRITQIPPMYSAIKLKGKTLYNLARKGKTVEREPREVTISGFEIVKIDLPEIHFEIVCSKGTYIRVIANDFGEKLGCGGILSSLRRTKIGNYSIEDALSVSEFVEQMQNVDTAKLPG